MLCQCVSFNILFIIIQMRCIEFCGTPTNHFTKRDNSSELWERNLEATRSTEADCPLRWPVVVQGKVHVSEFDSGWARPLCIPVCTICALLKKKSANISPERSARIVARCLTCRLQIVGELHSAALLAEVLNRCFQQEPKSPVKHKQRRGTAFMNGEVGRCFFVTTF